VNDELRNMCEEDDVIQFMMLFSFIWLDVKKNIMQFGYLVIRLRKYSKLK
jgi:hypothetical protein